MTFIDFEGSDTGELLSEGSEVQILPGVPTATKSCDFAAVIFLSGDHFPSFFLRKSGIFLMGRVQYVPPILLIQGKGSKLKPVKVTKARK